MAITLPLVALARLSVALVQGAALAVLYQANEEKLWPATDGTIFAPLLAIAIFVPLVIVSGLNNLRPRVLIVWTLLAIAICASLSGYDILRNPTDFSGLPPIPRNLPNFTVWFSLAAIIFIGHTIVLAGQAEGRTIATYPTYFDAAWKHGVQFALAVAFNIALWLLLFLGATLFNLINIEFFAKVIEKRTVFIPVTAIAFCCTLHVTDIHTSIVRGTRTLTLQLLSWLLPLMALIVAGFLLALVFTGLEPLWRTQFAGRTLLGAAAALIILINIAYQDGQMQTQPIPVLRYAKPVAAILLVPLTALAIAALHLRVTQHGWTPERITATACAAVAAFYTFGYVTSVVQAGTAMRWLESTNIIVAVIIAGLLIALNSPLLDRSRISVADQMRRLKAGNVTPEKFDFRFLRFDSGRFGIEALQQLATSQDAGPQAANVAQRARSALEEKSRYQMTVRGTPITPEMRTNNISVVYPAGSSIPDTFVQKGWHREANTSPLPPCLSSAEHCDAILTDLDGDGRAEIVLLSQRSNSHGVFKFDPDQGWQLAGLLSNTFCDNVRETLRSGRLELADPLFKDIVVNGQRVQVSVRCRSKPPADTPRP